MRRFLPWFILLFPALELWVLIQVGKEIGALATIGLVFFSVFIGFALLRLRGAQIAGGIQAELAAGRIPSGHILDTFCLMAAGWLFLFPGLISDATALLLLIPFVRKALFALIINRMKAGGFMAQGTQFTASSGKTGGMHWSYTTFGSAHQGGTCQPEEHRRANAVVIDCEPEVLTADRENTDGDAGTQSGNTGGKPEKP